MALPGYGQYPGIDPNLPSDISTDAQSIENQRRIAEAMLQRSMQPLPAQHAPYHWTQGLAQLFGAYTGRRGMEDASKAQGALGQRYQQGLADEVERISTMRQGREAIPAPAEDLGGGPAAPAQAADPRAAVRAAMYSQYAPVREEGKLEYSHMKKADEPQNLGPGHKLVTPGQPDIMNPGPPMVEHNFPVGNNQIQSHISHDRGVTWQPLPGSQPIDKFGPRTDPSESGAPVAVVTPDGKGVEFVTRAASIGRTPAAVDPATQAALTSAKGRAKILLTEPQAKLRVESMKQNMDRLSNAMLELHDDKGLPNITGTIAGRTWNLTNTATGAQAKLNSVKSQIFQESLQAMREASKTGGAVGNVSDREGDKLERTLAALDQAQSTDDFKAQLKKAVAQVKLSKELIQNAFDEQFGDAAEYSGPERRRTDGPPPGAVRPR